MGVMAGMSGKEFSVKRPPPHEREKISGTILSEPYQKSRAV